MRSSKVIVSVFVLVTTASFVPITALALPDLTPEIPDVILIAGENVEQGDVDEGCASNMAGRTLVRFSLVTRNLGPGDLVLGDPGCPICQFDPGAPCTNPLFECSLSHGHVHFKSFAHAELLNQSGTVVAAGRKFGFCILDSECPQPKFGCSFQGLTAGCADGYHFSLPCQYIDLTDTTGVTPGTYTLRVELDPDDEILEANEDNNAVEAMVQIIRGDLDGSGDVDRYDLDIILAARNTVASGLGDLRDLNRDGKINAVDARILITLCDRPQCATQ